MARPTKQGMDYFPHDTDASSDEKIDVLRTLYGNDGYAFYFIMLERIYRTPNFELDISDAETIQILAKKVEVSREKFAEMLQTALKRRCFCPESYAERQVLTSPGIKKRAEGVVQKRQKMASAYQGKVSATQKGVSDAETTPETTVSGEFPSREKESKGEESKVNISSPTSSAHEESFSTHLQTQGVNQGSLSGVTDKVLSIDNYFIYCQQIQKDLQFMNSTSMGLKIKPPELLLLIDEFTHEQRAKSKVYKDYSAYKDHCFSWLRIAATKSNGITRNTPNSSYPTRNGSGPRSEFGQGADLTGIVYKQESFKKSA